MLRHLVYRAIGSASVCASAGAVGYLSLTDGTPSQVKGIVASHKAGAAVIGSDLPVSLDVISHLAMWTAFAFVFFVAVHATFGLWQSVVLLQTVSLLAEVGQSWFTSTRNTRLNDALANVGGVVIGVTMAALAIGAVRLLASHHPRLKARQISRPTTTSD